MSREPLPSREARCDGLDHAASWGDRTDVGLGGFRDYGGQGKGGGSSSLPPSLPPSSASKPQPMAFALRHFLSLLDQRRRDTTSPGIYWGLEGMFRADGWTARLLTLPYC